MLLDQQLLDQVEQQLATADELLLQRYPGDDGRRQAVHTVYTPADQVTPDVSQQWGQQALEAVAQQGSMADLVQQVIGEGSDDAEYVGRIADLVESKLVNEPIEDLRIDFEDGYGRRSDAEEDRHAVQAAEGVAKSLQAGTAPPFVGIRFKCMESDVRARGLRTLDLYLSTLVEKVGFFPDSTVLTLPKVTSVDQVKAMNDVAAALESGLGLEEGKLRYEVQVETPQLIVGADGQAEVGRVLHAGEGRITSLHYGTYDYSASLGIAAAYQSMDHPAADFAKNVMLTAVAGTGVPPVRRLDEHSCRWAPRKRFRGAWALHAGLVGRHLRRGIYQGSDMHPAHCCRRVSSRHLISSTGHWTRQLIASGGMCAPNQDQSWTNQRRRRHWHDNFRSTSCWATHAKDIQQRLGISNHVFTDFGRDRT